MNLQNPPPLDEARSDAIRHCLHSIIMGNSRNMLPDYLCRRNGRMCVMYRQPYCDKHERYAGEAHG